MKDPLDESRLQIISAQLESLRAREPKRSFLVRAAARIHRDFLQKGMREKVRFAKYAVRESASRLSTWMRRRQRREPNVHVPRDRLLVGARCNGGLGDLIIYSALLDRFFKEGGRPIIHAVVHPLRLDEARFVFHESPSVALVTDVADFDHASTPYDVIMTLGDFLGYDFIRRERVERLAPGLLRKLMAAQKIQQPYRGFIDAQPLYDGLFATEAARSGVRRLDLLGWLGNVDFAQEDQLLISPDAGGYRRYHDLGLAARRYITLHNGWDNIAHRHTQNATKGWPVAHYERFVAAFKRRFPGVLVVQLGAKTSRPIAGVDIGLLDDTTLHEAAWILKHSLLHVDGDSGLVHLARALHTKSIVLFGPTNHEFFRYAQNENCFSTICGNCWWSTPNWMRSCPRGLAEPECMTSIAPEQVLDRAERYLRTLRFPRLKFEDARRWNVVATDATAAADPLTEKLFHQWRGRFIRDAIMSAAADDANLGVAIVGNLHLPASALDGACRNVRTFAFAADPARGGDSIRDYGSIYNIPEENSAFDVVVLPLLSDQVEYFYPAIKEGLRILRENGLLVMTYQFAAGETVDLHRALLALGADNSAAPSTAGGIVLRKSIDDHVLAGADSRANNKVGV